ncbi:carboxypeptidase-like regulatory domain-containing protein [Phocaeicola vulgatus]|nr:carboxypeptidase-like regulatory domain-containing protein [Phocaeicola vulgatus]
MHSVQQDNACTGVVVDQNGETVIGASVVVKGTTNGTITGLDGDFSIPNVKKGDVIVVSYVGYMNSEIIWGGQALENSTERRQQDLGRGCCCRLCDCQESQSDRCGFCRR